MKTVEFNMTWMMSGRQSIDLPDDIDAKDANAVRSYIKEHWDTILLPDGDYIADSDILDETCNITVSEYDENTNDVDTFITSYELE